MTILSPAFCRSFPDNEEISSLWESARPNSKIIRAILVLALILYLSSLSTLWNAGPDSALYLGTGRNLAQGKGFIFNGQGVGWISPGLPLLWAGIVKTFGESYLVGQLFMVACAALFVTASWRYFRRNGSGIPAEVVAVVLLYSYAVFSRSGRLETDLPFSAFLMLSLLGIRLFLNDNKWGVALALPALVAAVAFRIVGLIIIPGIVLGILIEPSACRIRYRWILAAAIAVIGTAAFFGSLWMRRHFQTPGTQGYVEGASALMSVSPMTFILRGLRSLLQVPKIALVVTTGLRLPAVAALPLAVPLALGMLHDFCQRRRAAATLTLCYIGALCCVGEWAISKRYFLPILPMLLYFTLAGFIILFRWLRIRLKQCHPRTALLCLIAFLLIAGIAADLKQIVEVRRSPDEWVAEGRWPRMLKLCKWIDRNTAADAVVLAHRATVIHYWTHRRAYQLDVRTEEGIIPRIKDCLLETNADILAIEEKRTDMTALAQALAPEFVEAAQIERYRVFRKEEPAP